MKRIVALVLVLMMCCMAAAAAETAEEQAPALKVKMEEIGHPELYDALVGEWYGTYLLFGGSVAMDAEGMFDNYAISVNPDASVSMKMVEEDDKAYQIDVKYEDAVESVIVMMKNENGETVGAMQLLDNVHLFPELEGHCLLINDNSRMHVFFKDYVEAAETAPASVNADRLDFYGKWTLSSNSHFGRVVEYEAGQGKGYAVGAALTMPGMVFSIDVNRGSANAAYQSYEGGVDFEIAEGFENGELTMVTHDMGAMVDGVPTSTAVCRLHEDGTLSVEHLGMRMVFDAVVIDPLTEYKEKAVIKDVQNAMNDEGFECGTADGVRGKKTKAAISAFQAEHGLTETGTVTEELLKCLRGLGYAV